MAFITSNGLTESETSRIAQAGGMTVHYHDIGAGDPVLFLHSYGPGTTAWITFHKTVGLLSQHFRCILMDLPNFSKTGPYRLPRGGARRLGADRGRPAGRPRHRTSALGRQLAGRAVGDGGGHH